MQLLSLYRRLTLATLAIALCTFAVSGAFATALPTGDGGILIIGTGGPALGITQVVPGVYCFNFGGASSCAVPATHAAVVIGASSDFSSAPTSTIKDFTLAPVTGFESVVGGGGVGGAPVTFDLTSVLAGIDPTTCSSNTVLATCTPAGSPFNILQTGTTQIAISFALGLNGYTGSNAIVTPYNGLFSTQIAGTLSGTGSLCSGQAANITNVVSCLTSGGTLFATWSATESPAPASSTPEPGTLLLMGSGLAGLAGYIRRFKRS